MFARNRPVGQLQRAETAPTSSNGKHATRKLGLSEIVSGTSHEVIFGAPAQRHRRIDGTSPKPLEITRNYLQTGSGFTEITDLNLCLIEHFVLVCQLVV